MSRVSLRWQLFVLAIAGILPLAVLAGAGLHHFFEQQRASELRRALGITRALATAVDAELERSLAALQVLASTTTLDRRDFPAFELAARRALATQPQWHSIILADGAGNPLVNTAVRAGEALPTLREKGSFEAVLRSMKPQVGNLAPGAARLAFALRVPVLREQKVAFVISAVVEPAGILEIVSRQGVAPDWVISVFDGRGARVARSRGHERFLGTAAAPSLHALMAESGDEGTGITSALEGDDVFTAFTRIADKGWSVALGSPLTVVNAAAARSTAAYGFAVAISLIIGLLAAALLARRISGPMAELRSAAQLLGEGRQPAVPKTRVREIHELGEALAAAGRQRIAIEREREELLQREQAARGEAESANRAKDHFLAMLGHELRNPLAALSNAAGVLELAASDGQSTTQAREVIKRQVSHLARLTDDLLDAAGALLGKIELRSEPVDLAVVAGQTLATLAATGRTAMHRVVSDLEETWIRGDAVRIDQIITNLLVNSVKYTPAAGTIQVRTQRRGNEALLIVKDNGAGLSPELAFRAFDLFVQGERRIDRAEGGLGVGLTLVRRLAELHDGAASVRSAGEGLGSEFTIAFPAIERPSQAPTAPAPDAPMLPRSVLVVEDNDDAREMLQQLLELHGHRVESARDGISGLEKALITAPDIALVDLGLPGIDGFELARRVRAADGPRLYLVALTGYGAPEDRERALAAGFDAHVTKPVEPEELSALLRSTKTRPPMAS